MVERVRLGGESPYEFYIELGAVNDGRRSRELSTRELSDVLGVFEMEA